MHLVIVGCGRVGAGLATYLADEGHDVVIVDKNPGAFSNLGVTFNGMTVSGTGIDQDILKRAGIEKAAAFAAVTSSDNVNIMAAQVAREIFRVPRVVARTNEPRREPIFHELGIATVSPTDLGAAAIKSMLIMEGIQARYTLGAGEVLIADVVVDESHGNRTLAEIEIPGKVRVCAIVREGTARVAERDFICRSGDVLIISARLDAFETFRGLMEHRNDKPGRFDRLARHERGEHPQ